MVRKNGETFFIYLLRRLIPRFTDQALPHASVLNLFTQHGWSLATAFQSNSIPPNSTSIAPSDTLIFTHPFNTPAS